MKKNKELTAAERSKIEILLREDYTITDISRLLEVHKSVISREVKNRSTTNGYFAWIAQINYEEHKAKRKRDSILGYSKYRNFVIDRLIAGWSPEQISGWLKKEKSVLQISYEAIYQFIYESKYGKENKLYQYLRRGKRRRTKKNGRLTKKSKIPNRVSIHERPIEVETRKEFGHWEGDSVIYANKKAINTLVERKTGLIVLKKLKQKTARLTSKAMIKNLKKYLGSKTLTLDNGPEFTEHERVAKETNIVVYFADPYSSWQRGSNENGNMLLRGYLPKKANIDKLTKGELQDIEDELNNRPRKRLGYQTPIETYQLENQNTLFYVAIAS